MHNYDEYASGCMEMCSTVSWFSSFLWFCMQISTYEWFYSQNCLVFQYFWPALWKSWLLLNTLWVVYISVSSQGSNRKALWILVSTFVICAHGIHFKLHPTRHQWPISCFNFCSCVVAQVGCLSLCSDCPTYDAECSIVNLPDSKRFSRSGLDVIQ